jgi:glucose/mannose-6-phosphate isomerase
LPETSCLDDLDIYETLDPSRFRDRIFGLPEQCKVAWVLGLDLQLPSYYSDIDNVVLCGVGGSAIGGELLSDFSTLLEGVSVTVSRDYSLPKFVDDKSLVIASSYSGNTGETIAAFKDGLLRGAKLLSMTSGGLLANMSAESNVPVVNIDYKGEPRTALGYSFITPLAIMKQLGIIEVDQLLIEEAIDILDSLTCGLTPNIPIKDNPAKRLALSLKDKFIIIYGGGVLSGVARRWTTQFNENAKSWAMLELFPEAGHNAIAGIKWPAFISKSSHGIILDSPLLNPGMKIRHEVIKELLNNVQAECQTVQSKGNGVIAQMLSVVLIGDYVSYYLAILNGEDPAPVEPLDYLKSKLYDLHGV